MVSLELSSLNLLLFGYNFIIFWTVLAKQAEKKAIIEQGKKSKNNKKRSHPPNDKEVEPFLKRPKSRGDLVSNTPSPLTLSSSRPASVLSVISTSDIVNGDELLDHQGSTDGSEVNSELSGPGTTPVRKLGKSRLGPLSDAGRGGKKAKQTSAPLGGRGRMQKSNKKVGSGSAAASAGAIAGAKAATNAAYAAYGIASYHLSPVSPGVHSSTHGTTSSTHSSPRVSPVPVAFVATSLVTTPPTNKTTYKAPSSLTYAKNNL